MHTLSILALASLPMLAIPCQNEIDIDHNAIYDLVWDIYEYVNDDRINRDAGFECTEDDDSGACTTIVLTGSVQIWGRRPNATVAEQARRDPANGDSFYAAKINVSSARYSSCDHGIVFKRRNVRAWENRLCESLKTLTEGGRKRRQDTQPRDQACYALTGSHSLSALFGTADYISQSGAVRAGFRMALHEGEVRVYCCSGSKDCHEWPPCRHVTLPIGHEEIAHELWLSE